MNKMNPFSARAAPFSVILFSDLFIAFEAEFEAVLFTHSGKLFLAKGIARSATTFFT